VVKQLKFYIVSDWQYLFLRETVFTQT